MSKAKSRWYQETEALLYNYYKSFKARTMALVRQIGVVRDQLMPSMVPVCELREGTNYSVSSPVETAAINRIEGDKIRKLERKIKNMETMMEIVEISIDTMLDSEQRQLVNLIYTQQKPWQQMCNALCLDKNTYYDSKNEIGRYLPCVLGTCRTRRPRGCWSCLWIRRCGRRKKSNNGYLKKEKDHGLVLRKRAIIAPTGNRP